MTTHRLSHLLRGAARAIGRTLTRSGARRGARTGPRAAGRTDHRGTRYPGDFTGAVRPVYAPHLDGDPDPGEIVWTWVPFEEDHARGKDRPVLLVGHDGPWLLALQLTSKDHDRDAAQEARYGRLWMDIGSGPWDARGRPSEVRINRVVRVEPGAVRREGAVLDRRAFDAVVAAMGRARR
ncbi:type II toxin-antitoxin system PemK/MazF family toxin [Isoptericola chiayiensis]|uniref:Type II toxin-antitoxin system PemK/MazF family toxin n=1 Tax=Isoptericola chiayiensis TaxID=579446 RepID=A0ABP8YJI0_9MICO|nr:hypothetical protein [Isoptericola chiayiensis]